MEKGKEKHIFCCRNSRFPSSHSTIIWILLTHFCFENLRTIAAKIFWRPWYPQISFYYVFFYWFSWICIAVKLLNTAELHCSTGVLSLILLSKETHWATKAENWSRDLPYRQTAGQTTELRPSPIRNVVPPLWVFERHVERRHWGILLY